MTLVNHVTGQRVTAGNHHPSMPRDIVERLIEDFPDLDRGEIFEKFRLKIAEMEDQRRAVEWYFFVNMHDYLTTNRNLNHGRRDQSNSAEGRAQRQAAIDGLVQQVCEVALMKHPLSDGTLLENATREQVAKETGWMSKIVQKLKPGQIVGKVLTEAQLRKMRGQP